MRATAERFDCPLIGGDISIWDHPMLLTVTIFAEPAGIKPVLRSGAKPGDAVCVTGSLGGAWACEESVSINGQSCDDQVCGVSGPHLTFVPRIKPARQLAELLGNDLHAMIDLSDGLATDLARVGKASNVSFEIDTEKIPLRDEAAAMSNRSGRPAWHHGMCDGEDYELCFTANPNAINQLAKKLDGVPITVIGRVIEQQQGGQAGDVWVTEQGGNPTILEGKGWEHGDE